MAKPTTANPTPPAPAAWTENELKDAHARSDKAERVRSMFAAIAPAYDLNNRVHSFGRDQAWRRAAVKAADIKPGDVVADIACGTGDLTELLARTDAAQVMGLDFTQEMLDLAEVKKPRNLTADQAAKVSYQQADAMALPLQDASVDAITIAFGIRNVQEPGRALAEFARVLKPGGRLVVLEFDRPPLAPVRWGNAFYSGWLMPRTATLLSRDSSGAYRYLPKSIEQFMTSAELRDRLAEHGFSDLRTRRLTFGVCACTRGVRSA